MHGTVCAGWRRGCGGIGHVFADVGHVFLGYRAQVDDGVGEAVCTSEGDDDTWVSRRMVVGDVTTAVGEERTCVECGNEGEGREGGAVGETLEGCGDAGHADAVGDVNDASEGRKGFEQGWSDCVVGGEWWWCWAIVEEGMLFVGGWEGGRSRNVRGQVKEGEEW